MTTTQHSDPESAPAGFIYDPEGSDLAGTPRYILPIPLDAEDEDGPSAQAVWTATDGVTVWFDGHPGTGNYPAATVRAWARALLATCPEDTE
ncbi:hypothetical protein [Sinomonas cyclohexanicum]|nr:hypothetical protein [Corynebacterium cyclohexanicum]